MDRETYDNVMNAQQQYVLGTYAPEILLTRGNMSWVWDAEGRKYLDFTTGISVCNLGHCHPRVTEAIQRQAAKLVHVSNLFYNENQPRLASLIAENSFGGRVFFCNSGAEANEGLMKFARRWGHDNGRYEIVCMDGSFHGRTLATLAATAQKKYRKGFAPDTPGFVHVPFNDLAAVRAAVTDKTAAVLLEPVQGEGGIVPAAEDYMQSVRELCSERNVLLLFDEVQCGMGRTGHFFAHQHYGVAPDAMALAKALGNGFPIGALVVAQEHAEVLPPGTHASTFGGTPLACAAGIAVFETFAADDVLTNCRKMSVRLFEGLREIQQKTGNIRELRGRGLMIGADLTVPVGDRIAAAQQQRLLTLRAGENVLRLLPPLTVTDDEVDQALAVLGDVLA